MAILSLFDSTPRLRRLRDSLLWKDGCLRSCRCWKACRLDSRSFSSGNCGRDLLTVWSSKALAIYFHNNPFASSGTYRRSRNDEKKLPIKMTDLFWRPPPQNGRCKSQGPKPYTTARLFCRETLAAAVACARALIGRVGAPAVTADPHWFLGDFVVAMASPLLLGDVVRALHAASEGNPRREGEEEQATRVLRDVVLPGAVERITRVIIIGKVAEQRCTGVPGSLEGILSSNHARGA